MRGQEEEAIHAGGRGADCWLGVARAPRRRQERPGRVRARRARSSSKRRAAPQHRCRSAGRRQIAKAIPARDRADRGRRPWLSAIRSGELMEDLEHYLAAFVRPTIADFERNPTSLRHAFIACVVTFHSVDYLAHKVMRSANL